MSETRPWRPGPRTPLWGQSGVDSGIGFDLLNDRLEDMARGALVFVIFTRIYLAGVGGMSNSSRS